VACGLCCEAAGRHHVADHDYRRIQGNHCRAPWDPRGQLQAERRGMDDAVRRTVGKGRN
jgi:hypothetical protein